MCERRFTNHAVRPKTVAIYTTPAGILRPSPIIGLQRYYFFVNYSTLRHSHYTIFIFI